MSHKEESNFYKRIKGKLESLPNTWFVRVQQIATRGTPDILLCVNGSFVALELKKGPKAARSETQKYNIKKITEAGGYAEFLDPDNWDAVYQKLQSIAKGNTCSL